MDSKKIRKSIGRSLGWIGLIFCCSIIKILPERYLYGLAKNLSAIVYAIARRQRKVALDSLTIAFGKEKSREEIEKIARDCFTFMAKAGLELLFMMDRPQLLKSSVDIENKEILDRALSENKGVILVSAHFGNFPIMLGRLSLEGYKTAGIMRLMRDSRAEKMFLEKRNRFKVKTIYSQPRRECVNATIQALRNNEVVFLPIDQNFGTAGVFVDFFGRKAATATGPIVFAQRTKAAIIPCFIVRQKDDRHKIILEPPLKLEEGKDPQETITINIQKLTNIIEAYIRKYPAEWGWIHRRWKSQLNP